MCVACKFIVDLALFCNWQVDFQVQEIDQSFLFVATVDVGLLVKRSALSC